MVTGAGGGIGSAISRRLGAEGAHVFICDVNEAAAKEVADALVGEGCSAEPLVFDLLDPEASASAVQQIIDAWGRLDVLVNNAGVNRRGNLLTLTENDWDLSFAVNVDSLFHLCRAVLPHMIGA